MRVLLLSGSGSGEGSGLAILNVAVDDVFLRWRLEVDGRTLPGLLGFLFGSWFRVMKGA